MERQLFRLADAEMPRRQLAVADRRAAFRRQPPLGDEDRPARAYAILAAPAKRPKRRT